jgi:hypothetical protein
MACFSEVALKATAIEMDPSACTFLRQRSAALRAAGRYGFDVICASYQHAFDDAGADPTQEADLARADVFTWWQEPSGPGAGLEHMAVLQFLAARHRAGQLLDSASALMLFDGSWPGDVLMLQYIKPWAKWFTQVRFNEFDTHTQRANPALVRC